MCFARFLSRCAGFCSAEALAGSTFQDKFRIYEKAALSKSLVTCASSCVRKRTVVTMYGYLASAEASESTVGEVGKEYERLAFRNRKVSSRRCSCLPVMEFNGRMVAMSRGRYSWLLPRGAIF